MIDRKKVKLIHNIVNFTNDFIGHMPEHLMQVTPMSELRFSPVSRASCLLRCHTASSQPMSIFSSAKRHRCVRPLSTIFFMTEFGCLLPSLIHLAIPESGLDASILPTFYTEVFHVRIVIPIKQ